MKNVRCFIAATAVAAAFSGCRTVNDVLNDTEREYTAGDYGARIPEFRERAEAGGVDELMWRLHLGGSLHLTGAAEDAVRELDSAEDIFARNDQTGVFRQSATCVGAMMTNDRAFPYSGGGQDRIFACLYKAVDYAAKGNTDAARSELNRVSLHQDNWLYERRKEIDEARERLREDAESYARENTRGIEQDADAPKAEDATASAMGNADFAARVNEGCGFNPAVDGDLDSLSRKDYLNLYASYATGIFRLINGDDSVGYFKELADLRPDSALFRSELAAATSGARPKDQVWVFVEDGLCPRRDEWRIDLPFVLIPYANRYILYAGMALPRLRYRDAGSVGYVLEASGAATGLECVQDMDALLKTEFDVYFRGALAREITRTIVKAGVQAGLGIAAENTSSYTSYGFRAAQVAAAAYAASVTQADLRSWTELPKRVYAVRVNRPADGVVTIRGDGRPVAQISVPEGNSMVFVRKTAPGAVAAVQVAGFSD